MQWQWPDPSLAFQLVNKINLKISRTEIFWHLFSLKNTKIQPSGYFLQISPFIVVECKTDLRTEVSCVWLFHGSFSRRWSSSAGGQTCGWWFTAAELSADTPAVCDVSLAEYLSFVTFIWVQIIDRASGQFIPGVKTEDGPPLGSQTVTESSGRWLRCRYVQETARKTKLFSH